MPDYFEPYDTTVHFISEAAFERDHQGAPHGGYVITTGDLQGHNASVEFSLALESNPNFTAAAMVAFGRAAARLKAQGKAGAHTVLEVPLYLLSQQPLQEIMETGLVYSPGTVTFALCWRPPPGQGGLVFHCLATELRCRSSSAWTRSPGQSRKNFR